MTTRTRIEQAIRQPVILDGWANPDYNVSSAIAHAAACEVLQVLADRYTAKGYRLPELLTELQAELSASPAPQQEEKNENDLGKQSASRRSGWPINCCGC